VAPSPAASRAKALSPASPAATLGPHFTAADILLSTCITWAVRYGVPITDAVAAYNDRVTGRRGYLLALKTNASPVSTLPSHCS
jgi:glutathione S-transferase